MAETFWFKEDRSRFFVVPANVELPPGGTVVVSERGERRRADLDAMTRWEISYDEARKRFTGEVGAAWARLVEGLAQAAKAAPPPGDNPLKALGERLARTPPDGATARVGEKLRAALASPELAHAMEEVGVKLQEAAKKLREQAVAPPAAVSDWEAALGAEDWALRFEGGNANAPTSPFGAYALTLRADATAHLSNEHVGLHRAWAGTIEAPVLAELRAALRAARGAPQLPAPLAPGTSLVRLALEGAGRSCVAMVEQHTARRDPAWALVFDLLWSVLVAMSGGVVKIGVGHRPVAVADLRAD